MLRRVPGWINYFLLWAFYSVLFVGIYYLLRWAGVEMSDIGVIVVMSAIYSGAYLAKWRYTEGKGWRFW